MGNITITRKELYNQVWAEPMLRVAKRYGISDVALGKHCRRHNIPKPPPGYWAMKAAGQPVSQPPLPDPDKSDQITIKGCPAKEFCADPAVQAFVEKGMMNEQKEENKIVVAETLRTAHPLVHAARAQLEQEGHEWDGLLHAPREEAALDVCVAKRNMRRALLIMDALLKAFAQRGYAVSRGPTVKILDEDIRFTIIEATEVKYEKLNEAHYHTKTRRPSGRLILQVYMYLPYGGSPRCRLKWSDGKIQRLENCLNDIVAGFLPIAARMQEIRIDEQRREEQRKQEEKREAEEAARRARQRQQRKEEQARVDALLKEADDWRSSRRLRVYIEAKKKAYIREHGDIKEGSKFAIWLDWAKKQADRLDPFTESPPSILDDPALSDEKTNSIWYPFYNL